MLSFYTNLMTRLRRDEKGATAVEYGIMVALIAVVIIVAVSTLGGTLNGMFETVSTDIKTPPTAVATP
ncbi:Flp family type IVb pilin [Pseudarthrobacter sp. NamE2]|uniref:Flp family type IVb pilin n=1 Tax=Pseudarthrobacter sp. NamE2 TaxID=2576838 RepID=UPI0010FDFDC0|nr:Flp family type IVb pilin [Pseudarthrobacter sp. NamE2]TLM85468.1 Flp family type IVb pilin [Pseudarthrobacter sp. NamE2]